MKIGPVEITYDDLQKFFPYLITVFAWYTKIIHNKVALILFISIFIILLLLKLIKSFLNKKYCPWCNFDEYYYFEAGHNGRKYICSNPDCCKTFLISDRTGRVYKVN